jgi:hypothetical protein
MWIHCRGIKQLEVDEVTVEVPWDLDKYYKRMGESLRVEIVVRNKTKIDEETITKLHSEEGLREFSKTFEPSDRLTVVSMFGTIHSLSTAKHEQPMHQIQVVLKSVLPAPRFLAKAESVLKSAGFKKNYTFIHFRPFADNCTETFKTGRRALDCKNLDELDELISRNQNNSNLKYVAFPPFLSQEGIQYLNETLHPKLTTGQFQEMEEIMQKWDACFEVSLLEQAMAVIAPHFDGCQHSSWTSSVQIFRHYLNKL